MGLLDGIGSALNSNAVDAAVDAGTSSATGGLWDTVGDYATTAFDWLNDNPEAASVLGGVATGVGSYYAQQDEQDWSEKMYRRKREDRMINPGTIDNYGSYVGDGKKGLLTNGMIAGGA